MNILTKIGTALGGRLFGTPAARLGKTSRELANVQEQSLAGGKMGMEWLKRMGKEPDVSQQALVKKHWGWVHAAATVSAVRVASAPLKLYAARGKGDAKVKRFPVRPVPCHKALKLRERLGVRLKAVASAEEFEEITDHPLLDLLRHVNDWENSFDLRELTSIMLDLTGNAYWYMEMNKALGIPSRLFLLRSQWVKIIPDRDKFISGFLYGNDPGAGESLELPPENVIHFKYPNPHDPWYGLGPVQAAAYAIESQQLRERFIIATMGNMARPDLIIRYVEGELDARERALVEREWNSLYQGVKNVGKVKVTDFRWELEKLGWNPSELKFNEGEEWILKKICAAFQIPQGLVDMSNISRAPSAGVDGADLFMARYNTFPRCMRMEEKLNEKLCPLYDDRLFLAFEDVTPADRLAQLNEDKARLEMGYHTVNELRARDGLDPVPWGDKPLSIGGAGSGFGPDGAPLSPEELAEQERKKEEELFGKGNEDEDEEDLEEETEKPPFPKKKKHFPLNRSTAPNSRPPDFTRSAVWPSGAGSQKGNTDYPAETSFQVVDGAGISMELEGVPILLPSVRRRKRSVPEIERSLD